MKKFFFTLFLLIILGGAGFFFGWVQFRVPPGQFGVISSKTHGIDTEIVRSGEFRWVWYKLIPTNVKVAVFNLDPVRFPIHFSSSLPSGNIYASFAGITNADFSWNLQGDIAFSIDPDSLILLTSRHNFTGQEDLDVYMREVSKDIELIILRAFSSASSAEDTVRLEQIMSGYSDPQIEAEIKDRYPEIRNFTFVIHSSKFPDFILYRQLRLMYEEFLVKQREYVVSSFARRAETHIETQLRLNELQRYGELLSRFPILLEYMQLGLVHNQ